MKDSETSSEWRY